MSLRERVRRLVSSSIVAAPADRLSAQEQEAILELAFLVMAADGVLRSEELEAFGGVVDGVRALGSREALASDTAAAGPSVAELVERMSADLRGADAEERVRQAASGLSRPSARRLAYKLATMLALVDREISEGEFQLDLTLIDALELSNAEAERLAAEAQRAVLE
jgi:hypothetical protein